MPTIRLPDLIDISKESEYMRDIFDKVTKDLFDNRKPLTEILNKMEHKKEKGHSNDR